MQDMIWFKSSYSDSSNPSDCVEIAAPATVHVRDSKHIAGPRLQLSTEAWVGFVAFAAER
ncbi:DUF397 domain-containing protein [Streptomyces sp. NPDC006172]|uniref:DUF397 domain-containing protein n=1 Tax=Streptomyces sp. NPDC006172 TaxID=3154470 RepID=UPI0033E59BE7